MMTMQEILLTLRKRFWLVIAGALIAGAVALVLSLLWPRSYEAEAMLLITKLRPSITLDPRFKTVAEENVVNLSIQDDQVRRQTLVALTESRDLALQVLDVLGDTLSPEERSVAFVRDAKSVNTRGNVLIFVAQAGSPTKAAAIANAWAEVYQEHVNRLYSTTSPTYDQIQAQLESAEASYEDAKIAVEGFIKESPDDELTRQVEQKRQILNDLQAAYLAAARKQVSNLLSRIDTIDRLLLDAQSLKMQLADPSRTGSPATEALTGGEEFALFALEAVAFAQEMVLPVTLEFGAGGSVWRPATAAEADSFPSRTGQDAVTAGQAIDQLDHLAQTLETAREVARSEVDSYTSYLLTGEDLLASGPDGADPSRTRAASVEALQAEISTLEAELQRLGMQEQDLIGARTVARESYFTLIRKAAEVQILSQLTGVEVQIAADAQPPENPVFPRPLLATLLGVVAGGLAGLALIFVLEMWPREEETTE
jgi:uncharacterized protein involved in exopolysaccharide biosynthesis